MTALPDQPRSQNFISRAEILVGLALAAVAAAILHRPWFDIFRLGFNDEELNYVLLAPVVIAWLAYSRRRTVMNCGATHGWVGILILLFGWAVFWYGEVADPVLWRAGAVVVAVGSFVSATGFSVFRKLAPVFAACLFLVPVLPSGRYRIAAPLQTATAVATQNVCDLIGITVDRAQDLLTINGVKVTIAEACNGMRMILTLFLVCYVVAFSMPMQAWARLLFLLSSPLVAIVSNVARLVPTIWMFGNRSAAAAKSFHDVSGWVMTLIAFLLLLGLANLIRSEKQSPLIKPISRDPTGSRSLKRVYQWTAAALLAGIAIHQFTSSHVPAEVQQYQQNIRTAAERIPHRFASWVGEDVPVSDQSMTLLRPNVILSRRYLNVENGATAGLLFVHCSDAHSMAGHFPLRCYPARGWKLRSAKPRDWVDGNLRITGTEYTFSREEVGAPNGLSSIVVANCLLRPSGEVLRDMNSMANSIIGAGGESSGAGQIQIYFDARVPQDQRDTEVIALIHGYRPVIDAVLANPGN